MVAELLAAEQVCVEIRQPLAGDSLLDPDQYSGAVIFGGAMSANDEHLDGIAAEIRWADRAIRAGLPLFGICLGAQMIAKVLGGEVGPRDDGQWEIGYRTLEPTEAGRQLFSPQQTFFQWHGEGFTLPQGAERLAGSALFPQQAFRYGGNVFGTQFHPEVSQSLLHHWQAEFAHDMCHPGGDSIAQQRRDDALHRAGVESWLMGFLSHFVSLTRENTVA